MSGAATDRKTTGKADAQALARSWFTLAEAGDLLALLAALSVRKRAMEAAREVMKADPARYAAFVQMFVAGLADRRPRVRFEAAHALDQFGDARCRSSLADLMDDPVPRVRWMAMHALSCHACGEETVSPDPAVEARIAAAALTDPSIRVRRNAAGALGLARRPSAVPTLRRLLAAETDAKLRNMAAWALDQCEEAAATTFAASRSEAVSASLKTDGRRRTIHEMDAAVAAEAAIATTPVGRI